MRIRYLAAIAAVVAVVPLAVHYLLKPGDDQLEDTLRELGFIPNNPPSTLMSVGSLYFVNHEGRHFYPICVASKEDIGDALRSSRSVALQQTLERKGQAASGISIGIGWLLRGSANNNYAVKVNYSFTDVLVEEISMGVNREIFRKLMNQQSCNEIALVMSQRGYVCQVTSILSATAEYKLDRDAQSKLDTGSKAEVEGLVKRTVEAQGNQEVIDKEGRVLAGKALQYGAVWDPNCLAPPRSRFTRTVPQTALERYWNYVLFRIIEPILPVKPDEVEVAHAHTGT